MMVVGLGMDVVVIFDIIEYTRLFENAVQNGLGQTPSYANVGLVGTGCAVVGSNQ